MLLLEETFGLAPERAGDVLRQIKAGERPKRLAGLSADRRLVEKACEFIINDPKWGWEDWNNNVMMPLFNASKGEDWGRELAHALSAQHNDYNDEETDERWDDIAKHPADLLGWPRLNWLARQNGMPFLGPLDWDNYRVFMDRKEILNVTNNHWIISERFNDLFADYKEKNRSVMQTFVKSRSDQVFDAVIWDSSLPSGAALKKAKRYWNTWKAPDWWGEPGDITPWLVTLDRVFGGDMMDIVIKRMACDVQYPEIRPQWHLLTIGGHGIGKSDAVYPLMEWGKRFDLHSSITPTMIKSEFNSWLSRKKIITLNEIFGITSAQFDDLKDMLAGGESEISINEKMMKRVSESIIASFYMSSNQANAVSVSRTERRLLINHSLETSYVQSTPKQQQELKDNHSWIIKNWSKVIYHLKNNVSVEPNFIQVHPGITLGQQEMADITAPAHERIAENIRELMGHIPVFTIRGVINALSMDDTNVDAQNLNTPMVQKAFSYLHIVRLNKGSAVKVKPNGHWDQKRLWSFDHELVDADPKTLRFLYEAFTNEEE
jgi:hypothetical protein